MTDKTVSVPQSLRKFKLVPPNDPRVKGRVTCRIPCDATCKLPQHHRGDCVPTESRPCCDCLIVVESDGALNQEHKEGCQVGKLYKAFRAACYWVWRMTDEPGMTVEKMMSKFMNGEIKEEQSQ